MTMVLPSLYDVVDTHHHLLQCNNAVVYGVEIDSIRRRRSTSPAASIPTHCNYFNSSDNQIMADELIRPDYDPNQPSSSSIDPTADENWLNLRLGGDDRPSSSSTLDTRRGSGGGLVELDLLSATSNTSHRQQHQQLHHLQLQQQVRRSNTRPPGFFHPPEFRAPPRPELNWAMMRPSYFIGGNYYAANPASTSLMPVGPNFFARPSFDGATQMGYNGEGMPSSRGMRIIRPPRRPNVGIWFMLQASQNQVTEPFLPQIPKSYLRIKNEQMTVRLLMKYLVQKLGLESESEVEIRCRGQELEPNLTMQHVRDTIWCQWRGMPVNLPTDSPSSSTSVAATDSLIMILHYARPILLAATAAEATTGTSSSSAQIDPLANLNNI